VATPKNRSVLKAFALLRAFGGPDQELTSAELSRRAGLPEASGYRLMQTLEAVGAVVRVSRGRYRPGFLLTALSRKVSAAEVLSDAAHGVLEGLAERFGATAHLGILEHEMVTYVAKASSPRSVPVPTRVGAQQEAYCSAIGKVLLAGLSSEGLERFLRQGELVALTERTITDPAVFRDEIARVREERFALDTGETHAHLCCVAVPVRDQDGAILAALSLVDRIETLDDLRRDQARVALSLAAEQMETRVRDWIPRRRPQAGALRLRLPALFPNCGPNFSGAPLGRLLPS
jgi:DNA-binding IclR family transcriptional regulator